MFIILGKTSTRVVLASALIGRVFIMLLYPPLNEVEGEYTGFTLSVHLRIILHVILCVMAGMQRIGNAEIFSALWLKCGYNAEISPYSCPNTPIRIFSAFPPHFFPHFLPYKNAEISPRPCPNTPIRIFSARKMRRSGVRVSIKYISMTARLVTILVKHWSYHSLVLIKPLIWNCNTVKFLYNDLSDGQQCTKITLVHEKTVAQLDNMVAQGKWSQMHVLLFLMMSHWELFRLNCNRGTALSGGGSTSDKRVTSH